MPAPISVMIFSICGDGKRRAPSEAGGAILALPSLPDQSHTANTNVAPGVGRQSKCPVSRNVKQLKHGRQLLDDNLSPHHEYRFNVAPGPKLKVKRSLGRLRPGSSQTPKPSCSCHASVKNACEELEDGVYKQGGVPHLHPERSCSRPPFTT